MNPLPTSFHTLRPAPARPLKGRGHARERLPFTLHTKSGKACWQALPEAHKAEVATKTKGDKNFHWRRFVSPEAYAVLLESQKSF